MQDEDEPVTTALANSQLFAGCVYDGLRNEEQVFETVQKWLLELLGVRAPRVIACSLNVARAVHH